VRILVLISDAFGGYGGIALYNRDMLTALCSHPNCNEVVAIPRLVKNPGESKAQLAKLTYVTDGLHSKSRYIRTVFWKVLQNPRFDLIVCGHINLIPVAMFLRTWLRAPVLLEIYGIDAWQPTSNHITNLLVRKVDAFISISKITLQRFLAWSKVPAEKGFILPNAIHKERYGVGPKKQDLLRRYGLEGKTVLMTLGRLVSEERYKGFDEVIEVLPELAKEIPDIAYLIIGKGDDRRRLMEKARKTGVSNRVVFTGFIDESEKADHFRLADTYVMPSQGEGFGFVFLEALACGIPVVASKMDGGREAIRNGKLGLLADPTNKNDLIIAIRKSLNKKRRLVKKELDYFSFEKFVERQHHIVNFVVGEMNGFKTTT